MVCKDCELLHCAGPDCLKLLADIDRAFKALSGESVEGIKGDEC